MVSVPARGGAQLIENDALCPFVRQRVADRGRLGHCPALGQCQPHHLGLPRPPLTDQVGAPHARIFNEATNHHFARILDESTRSLATIRFATRMFERMVAAAMSASGPPGCWQVEARVENAACALRESPRSPTPWKLSEEQAGIAYRQIQPVNKLVIPCELRLSRAFAFEEEPVAGNQEQRDRQKLSAKAPLDKRVMTMARQSIRAREAAQIAPKCMAEITGREPAA